ncbi:MAG: amidase [Acidobacteriota bacterium]|nr:MAG: amidase [Acidobacteriota bacterium]
MERNWSRRQMLGALSALGAGSAVFGRAVATLAAEESPVTVETIRQASWIAGMQFTDDELELMAKGVNETLEAFDALRAIRLDNGIAPALRFVPPGDVPEAPSPAARRAQPIETAPPPRPGSDDELAFMPLTELSALIRTRAISSVELTRLYLERLRDLDPRLHCVITLTEALALEQAARTDRELSRGIYRGPLHGIPWGAKDLLSVPGYPTTWGAFPYRGQVLPTKATVVSRLEHAGAVLVAKLSLGALAWGDVWFGGTTCNPWNLGQGSSGSSAGSAAAAAAGLVGFAIGSETWGSIVSPCTRCGATGLRPTFGRVSRFGAMALSWSMDKLGPIARSVEDCALVFDAIHGADGLDPTASDRPFHWPARKDVRALRVGFVKSLFEEDRGANAQAAEGAEQSESADALREWQRFDNETLYVLERLGIELVPIELPDRYPVDALSFILTAEASTAFDELTRSSDDDLLLRQVENAWPNVFRQGQLIPAVEYIRANRIRTLVIEELERTIEGLDAYVAPSFGGSNLLMTNLTGHPAVVLPNGFRSVDGTPTSITFTGRLNGESELLALAHAYQQATDFHLQRPELSFPDES